MIKAQPMRQTVEVTIDEQGNVRLREPIRLWGPRRAVVTIFADEREFSETALLSEAALAEDWDRPEEDAAWSYLQRKQLYGYPEHYTINATRD